MQLFSKLRKRLRANALPFELLGLGVILSTFLIKDVLKEGQKERIDDLNSARRSYDIFAQIWDVQKSIDVLLAHTNYPGTSLSDIPFEGYLTGKRTDIDRLLEHVESVLHLARDANQKKLIEPLTGLTNSYSILRYEVEHIHELHRKALVTGVTNEVYPPMSKVLDAKEDEEASFANALGTIFELNEDIPKVLAQCSIEAEKEAKNYRTFQRCSYGIFAGGFLLTVFGRLFGLRGVAEGS
jgi:hypothetical protein